MLKFSSTRHVSLSMKISTTFLKPFTENYTELWKSSMNFFSQHQLCPKVDYSQRKFIRLIFSVYHANCYRYSFGFLQSQKGGLNRKELKICSHFNP